ncbi:MAG: imidazoleglycerol-phosphate dehydratase HisB [Roseburia sp.]|nr:imidazoleglycerol-phosphate dehydratase HisB [Roseburia sp.]MCM1099524.1 imidazoleglycerol-phosphate dehydratase HisB [Ruminococcus flavefaciens]
MERTASISRKTKETEIHLTLNLDGSGKSEISTGIGLLDHMLESFARHGFFDLTCQVKGDLEVDGHHTTEDTGIVLGQAVAAAVGDKKGICRYGSFLLPMDDALALCAVDLGGRPYLNFDCRFPAERVGGLDTELVREFFYAVSYSAGMNLHLKLLEGQNSHHMIEAMFKAFAKALDNATRIDTRINDVLSTKGRL